ncbi:MAG: tRNA pseudouridine(55) synthase TruB [Actinobacteria bacterium]|nr:tRNA pseudouridine(55) synthase TruB [Actinomycetota bacterium]
MASRDCAIALVDKPAGITSHDVVFRARGRLSALASDAAGERVRVKTGHAGTLDPFATGLLLILTGRATRLQRYLLHLPKTYVATARLGWRSDTGDRDGELTRTGLIPEDPELPAGKLLLPVPAHSAIKVGGERLYAKARRGEVFTPPEREMTVYRAERMQSDGERATFEIDCAGGTYVRSVVATLHDAYCEELRRTRIGGMRVEDAVVPDDLSLESLIDPLVALAHLPGRELDEADAMTMIHGRTLDAGEFADDDAVSLVCDDRLLGVGRVRDGALRPETVLAASLEELRAR